MKERLLFALMAMCVAVSGFALSVGEYVYTPKGRFLITSQNVASSNFADFTGWTAIGEGKTLADLFNTNANGYAEGMNSVVSLAATAGEGMYFKFEPADAGLTYVVSFKMKGVALDNVKIRIPGDGNKKEDNLVKVAGNEANTYTYPSTDGEVIVNTAEELTTDWQTFNYAIVGDGVARTWFISFTTMATTIEIADLQIAAATQVADLRQRDEMLEKLNAYKNCYEWDADVLDEYGITEGIEALEGITDASTQATLDLALETANVIINEFVKANMDDYLAGNSQNYLGFNDTGNKLKNEKTDKSYGDWTATDRASWAKESYPDIGHYAGNSGWKWNDVDGPLGVYMQKTLDPGSYVFGIESNAAVREDPTSSSWTINEGWDVAYGIAYIVKIVDGVATDTIVSQVKGLEAVNYIPFIVPAKITEAGTYEIGFKAYCKDAYKELKNGSVVYVKDASFWGKNENIYNQAQLGYEADVREQIATSRDAITKANGYLVDEAYLWGKDVLKDSVDAAELAIAPYEAMSQDEIIYTYDNAETDYERDNRTKSAEQGLLVYEVYDKAVRGILAANKKFLAVNDTLNSMQAVIDAAEATLKLRLYDAATGKDALKDAITKAKGIQAEMKAAQYSIENAATIVAANKELNDAIDLFKTTIPESAIATIVDIDFEQDAVLDESTGLYSVPGAVGSMEFTNWSVDGSGNQPMEKGYWVNGEQLWQGYIRIGNGTGTVNFDPTVDGSMGTNILKVACDLYIQGLSGRSLGFFLKYVNEEQQEANVFGLFRNYYNGTTETNTCDVDVNMIWAKSGGSYNNASPADATDSITANPLQKSHFEVIMDYGKQTMYCTISSVNGSTTSNEVALEAVPTKFVLQCNYNNNDRRAWFDNLKIQRIAAGAYDGIADVNAAAKVVMPKKVIKNGRIVINGKYGVNGIIIRK